MRKNNRLKYYDYGLSNFYFVTICTKVRINCLSKVVEDKTELTQIGKTVKKNLYIIEEHFTNIKIADFWVIMPNHIHFIVIVNSEGSVNPTPTLGKVIAFFKYKTTQQLGDQELIKGNKFWQRNYYDHVIRNEKDLLNIRNYIE